MNSRSFSWNINLKDNLRKESNLPTVLSHFFHTSSTPFYVFSTFHYLPNVSPLSLASTILPHALGAPTSCNVEPLAINVLHTLMVFLIPNKNGNKFMAWQFKELVRGWKGWRLESQKRMWKQMWDRGGKRGGKGGNNKSAAWQHQFL